MKKFFSPKLWDSFIPGKEKEKTLFYNPDPQRSFVFGMGTAVFLAALGLVVYFWFPLAKEIVAYQVFKYKNKDQIAKNFSEPTPAPAEPTPTLPPVPDTTFSVILPILITLFLPIGAKNTTIPKIITASAAMNK